MSSVQSVRTDVLLRSEETGGHVSVTEIEVPAHHPESRADLVTGSHRAVRSARRKGAPGGPSPRSASRG